MISFSNRGDALIGQEMFSILDRATEIERLGGHVYHLELGDPASLPPNCVVDGTVDSLLNNNFGYAPCAGLLELRQEVASYYSLLLKRNIHSNSVVISPANLLIFQFLDIIQSIIFFYCSYK